MITSTMKNGQWLPCDQFTSQPEYWEELRQRIGDEPSTYDLILPEVYLENMCDEIIDGINHKMYEYINQGILKNIGPSMILVERKTLNGKENKIGFNA